MSGPSLTYPECFKPIKKVIGTKDAKKAAGIYILTYKDRTIFLQTARRKLNPGPEDDLSDIASSTSKLFEQIMNRKPKVAFLSYSNFGSNKTAKNKSVRLKSQKKSTLKLFVDGEMQADVAIK